MSEIDYDKRSLLQIMQDILSVDNEEKLRTFCLKLTQLSYNAFMKLVNEHIKLIFRTRDSDNLIMNMDILQNPEKCSDPYIRLGLMSFTFMFTNKVHFMRQNIFITISQIVVDKYIPYVEGHLINSHILIDLINIIRETNAFSCIEARFEISGAALKLEKNPFDLLDEFYANIIDLFAQLILVEIKCMNFKNISDVLLVSNDIVNFFDIYYEISEYIVLDYPVPKSSLLIEKSVMSAIAVITNCIILFQAKLFATDIDSLLWSNMICMMEKLRDHMVSFSLPPSSGTSLQRFLIERAHGNFNTNCTNKLYIVTNYINQVNITKRSSDITAKTSLKTLRVVLYHLKRHVNSICYRFNIKHRVIKRLYSVNERYTSNSEEYVNALYSTDESLTSSGSEDSNFETDGETYDLYSDDESSTDDNEISGTDENSEHI
ncbi:unnamed protein product [Meganyctiphanes norvegica]|uniref:Uncharacterized protein n=1 Tax=Meganyctiphanes norvegica TaxID=48144 RepID=A0AAV2QM93_MEGNR